MDCVFTVEAIALCEQRGHQWAWRAGWGDCGFHECRRCGQSGPVVQAGATPPAVASPAASAAEQLPAPSRRRSAKRAPVAAPRDAGTTEPAAAELAPAAVIGRPRAHAERDREIAWRVGNGEPRATLAAEFGIHVSRVQQILAESKGQRKPRISRPQGYPGHRPNVARDAEIVRRRLAGESPSLLAAEFGLHPSRIPQIVRRGTAAAGSPS